MIKTDILFAGYYGEKNTGDDAFVEVAQWGAHTIWNKTNNRFIAKSENLPNTIIPAKGYFFSIPKTYGFQAKYLVNNADYLISAGGSTINGKLGKKNPKNIAINRKAKGGDIKIGGIGVSIGPFTSIENENAVKSYLKSIDFLAVRDQYSFDYVSALNLPYKPINAFDLAALLPEIYNFSSTKDKVQNKMKTIGVSVCPYESVKGINLTPEKKRNEDMVSLLKEIDKKEEVHFKFYVINGDLFFGDYNLTKETIQKVAPKSYEVIEYSKNTKNIWLSIANCDFVISTRLHAAIFACFAETPFMLNEYHRKCTDFLENIAYSHEYRLYNSEFNPVEKSDQIIEILNDKSKYKKPNKRTEMVELAKLNFTGIKM